jgi:hypothetical protein
MVGVSSPTVWGAPASSPGCVRQWTRRQRDGGSWATWCSPGGCARTGCYAVELCSSGCPRGGTTVSQGAARCAPGQHKRQVVAASSSSVAAFPSSRSSRSCIELKREVVVCFLGHCDGLPGRCSPSPPLFPLLPFRPLAPDPAVLERRAAARVPRYPIGAHAEDVAAARAADAAVACSGAPPPRHYSKARVVSLDCRLNMR